MTKATATKPTRSQHRRSRGPTTSPPEDRLRTVSKNTPFKPRKESSLSLLSHMKKLSLGEPSVCTTPEQRLFALSLASQDRHKPTPNYLVRVQRDDIKGFMRYDVLEWILRMNKKLDYHPETFAVTANVFDRLLSTVRVKAAHLQLIGATCFLLAAKMHEVWNTHPSLVELVAASNHAFSCNDIERMEKQILLKLDWALSPPTANLMVHQLLPLLSVPAECHPAMVAAAEAALERAVLCERFLQYDPSTMAACALMRIVGHSLGGVPREKVEAELVTLTRTTPEAYMQCSNDFNLLMLTYVPAL